MTTATATVTTLNRVWLYGWYTRVLKWRVARIYTRGKGRTGREGKRYIYRERETKRQIEREKERQSGGRNIESLVKTMTKIGNIIYYHIVYRGSIVSMNDVHPSCVHAFFRGLEEGHCVGLSLSENPPFHLPFHDSSQFFFELFVSNFTSPPSDPILFLFPVCLSAIRGE